MLFVLLIVGISSVYYAAPNTFDPVTEKLSESFSVPVSNESSNVVVSKNTSNNVSNTSSNDSSNNEINNIPNKNITNTAKDGYSEITIEGLKCYIHTEYDNFTPVTVGSNYEDFEGYLDVSDNNSVNFVEYNDFSQLSAKNGSFYIFIANASAESNGSEERNDSKDHNGFNDSNLLNNSSTNVSNDTSDEFVNGINSTDIKYNGSNITNIESIILTNDSNTENLLDNVTYGYTKGNISNDTNIMFLDNNVRIVHYIQYSDENNTSEMTWAYFKVNGSDVAIAWAGDSVDMYVIESFFKLN